MVGSEKVQIGSRQVERNHDRALAQGVGRGEPHRGRTTCFAHLRASLKHLPVLLEHQGVAHPVEENTSVALHIEVGEVQEAAILDSNLQIVGEAQDGAHTPQHVRRQQTFAKVGAPHDC